MCRKLPMYVMVLMSRFGILGWVMGMVDMLLGVLCMLLRLLYDEVLWGPRLVSMSPLRVMSVVLFHI